MFLRNPSIFSASVKCSGDLFETDTNLVKIMYRDGSEESLPLMSKEDVANHLLVRIKALRDSSP